MCGYPGGWEQLREDEEAEDAAAEEREREAEEADERAEQARMDEFDRGHDAYLAEQWELHASHGSETHAGQED